MATVGAAPDSSKTPSESEEGTRLKELVAIAPGPMETETGVFAGVAEGRKISALTLNGCSSVVFKAAPPTRLSATKMTFCPLPGRVDEVRVPAASLEKFVRSGGPVTTVFQAAVLAPAFQ
jgi:hypothetical protein